MSGVDDNSIGRHVPGRVVRLFFVTAIALSLLWIGSSQAASTGSSPVDAVIARCPTAAEVAQVNAAIPIDWGTDPSAGTFVCHAAEGSADLTLLQERVYQAFTIMRRLSFTKPLPWTSESLYDWFVGTAKGVKFIPATSLEGGNGFCCSPEGVINIVYPGPNQLKLNRWEQTLEKDPYGFLGSAFFLITTMVHEVRHIEVGPHTCGINDKSYTEMGASAVSPTYLRMWLALYSGHFLDAPGINPSFYRESLFVSDDYNVTCDPPTHTQISVAGAPFTLNEGGFPVAAVRTKPVRSGGVLVYKITGLNKGPGAVADAFVYSFIPRGSRLIGASVAGGSCTAVSRLAGSSVGCELGPMNAGAKRLVTIRFRVTAKPGTTITNRPVPGIAATIPRSIGTAFIGFAYDPKWNQGKAMLVQTKVVR